MLWISRCLSDAPIESVLPQIASADNRALHPLIQTCSPLEMDWDKYEQVTSSVYSVIQPQRAARLYNVTLCAARLFLRLRQLYWSWLSRTLWAPWEMSQLYITPAHVCVSAVMQTGTHTPTASSPLLVLPFSLSLLLQQNGKCAKRGYSRMSAAAPFNYRASLLNKPSVLTLPSLHPARAQSKDVRPSKPETVTRLRLNNVSQPKLRAVSSNSIQSKPERDRNTWTWIDDSV